MGILDDNPQILRIRQHLVEHLGPPEEVFEVTGSPLPNSPVQALNLAYFSPQGPQSPVVFATCGASLFTMKDGRRIEGLVILRREPDAEGFASVQRLLGSFSLFAESNDEVIQINDVLHAPKELTQFCQMDALLFMPPIPFVQKFHKIALSESEYVDLLWLLPVYTSEAEYAMQHGPQAVMMLFAAQSLDLTDPDRGEANTLVTPEDAAVMAQRTLAEHQASTKDKPVAPAPSTNPVKMKSSRRDIGRGSFDVSMEGGQVHISRRGSLKKAAQKKPNHTPSSAANLPPSSPEELETGNPLPKGPTGANRPAVRSPRPGEVRFDLTAGTTSKRSKPRPEPAREAKPKPESAMSSEEREIAKQQRIADLKKKAKQVAEQAKKRKKGEG